MDSFYKQKISLSSNYSVFDFLKGFHFHIKIKYILCHLGKKKWLRLHKTSHWNLCIFRFVFPIFCSPLAICIKTLLLWSFFCQRIICRFQCKFMQNKIQCECCTNFHISATNVVSKCFDISFYDRMLCQINYAALPWKN